MHALLSKAAIARRLDADPRTLNGILEEAGVEPDFVQGPRKLFHAARVKELRQQIQGARK